MDKTMKAFPALAKGDWKGKVVDENGEPVRRNGDTQYYPGGVTDPNYCVLTSLISALIT